MANKTNTIQELNLTDSFLFGKVMSDTEICRMVLEKILNVPIKKAEFPVTKKILCLSKSAPRNFRQFEHFIIVWR